MTAGARTPEELETLLEDAFVVRDGAALRSLFEESAVLATDGGAREAQGGEAIERAATAMWCGEITYLADPRRIVQARDTALVVAGGGISVVHRGGDGAWRYVISLLSDNSDQRKGPSR